MKNEERFLAVLVDKDGQTKDFYRFSYKKAETVRKNIEKAASSDNDGMLSLYRRNWMNMGVVKCLVYAKNNGCYPVSPTMSFDLIY